jgi:2-keto-4-pentenoate hydratase
VVDSIFTDYRFTIADNTADGSSAAQVVLGPSLGSKDSLADVEVALRHNGVVCAEASGAAASGHPLNGVAWLVEQLAVRGIGLRAGDLVITGGLTAAVALLPGDVVSATFHHLHGDTVSVQVSRVDAP